MSAPAPIHVSDVAAAHGGRWMAGGFALVKDYPLAWLGLAVGWLVMTFGPLLVPLIGILAAYLLQPVYFASFALAAKKQLAGERPVMGDLFLGFRGNVRALMGVGMIELAAVIAASVFFAAMGVPAAADEAGRILPPEELMAQLQGKEWYLLGGFLVVIVVKGVLWFTPALIAFHGLNTLDALRWSLYAALSNLGAMFVYGIVLTLVFLAAILPWGLGLFLAIPVMVASTYAGYRDVFENPEELVSG
jgi:uncharacterized membrane protein